MDAKARAQFFGQDALKTVHCGCFEKFVHPGTNRVKNKFIANDKYNILQLQRLFFSEVALLGFVFKLAFFLLLILCDS